MTKLRSENPVRPLLATNRLKRHYGLATAQGQEADIAVLAIDPHFQGLAYLAIVEYPVLSMLGI